MNMEMCKWGEDGNEAYPNLNKMFETSARQKILECDVTIVCVFNFFSCPECFDLSPVVFVKSRDQNLVGIHDVLLCFSFGYAE